MVRNQKSMINIKMRSQPYDDFIHKVRSTSTNQHIQTTKLNDDILI